MLDTNATTKNIDVLASLMVRGSLSNENLSACVANIKELHTMNTG